MRFGAARDAMAAGGDRSALLVICRLLLWLGLAEAVTRYIEVRRARFRIPRTQRPHPARHGELQLNLTPETFSNWRIHVIATATCFPS